MDVSLPPAAESVPSPPPPPLPWEDPHYPRLEALYETAKLLLLSPTEAFRRVNVQAPFTTPLLFAVIFAFLGNLANQIYSFAFRASLLSLLPGLPAQRELLPAWALSVLSVVLVPLVAPLIFLLSAGIYHLSLLLLGAASRGFEATFRVLCYAQTPYILQVIPLVGGVAGFVWSLILLALGFATVHQTSTAKGFAAVLLPILLCCVCGLLILGALVGSVANLFAR